MVLPSLLVLGVLAVFVLLRLAFGLGHLALYVAIHRLFARLTGAVGRVGRGLSRLALLLPVGGFVATLVEVVSSYREMPPGGMRRIVELPVLVVGSVVIEAMVGLVVVGVLMAVLWLGGARRGRAGRPAGA